MTPVKFKEAWLTYVEDQPEYHPLPAWKDEARLWLMQLNFGTPLQPQLPTVENPFHAGKD